MRYRSGISRRCVWKRAADTALIHSAPKLWSFLKSRPIGWMRFDGGLRIAYGEGERPKGNGGVSGHSPPVARDCRSGRSHRKRIRQFAQLILNVCFGRWLGVTHSIARGA